MYLVDILITTDGLHQGYESLSVKEQDDLEACYSRALQYGVVKDGFGTTIPWLSEDDLIKIFGVDWVLEFMKLPDFKERL